MNLKRLFTRKVWILVGSVSHIRRRYNPILEWEDKQVGQLVIERNQFGDERARWTNGRESSKVDLAYAKAYVK